MGDMMEQALTILLRMKYWFKEVGLGIRNIFRRNSVKKIIRVCLVLIGILFVIAIFYHHLGNFVVTIDPALQKKGVYLSTTEKFDDLRVKLFGSALKECNNINIADIPLDIDQYEGTHNGKNYVAYTFYVRNEGKETISYEYDLSVGDSSKGVEEAAWIMLFKNGKQQIYAKERGDKTPERQYAYIKYPIMEQADEAVNHYAALSGEDRGYLTNADIERLGILDIDGLYELRANPFLSDSLITRGIVTDMEPKEYDRYTVVIWLEGEDPDCVDAIKGGFIELRMRFSIIDVEEETEE